MKYVGRRTGHRGRLLLQGRDRVQGQVGHQPRLEPHRHRALPAEAARHHQAEARQREEAAQPQRRACQAVGHQVRPGKDWRQSG